MQVFFLDDAWEDYQHWQQNDKKVLKKINDLLKEISPAPYQGTGSPEALKHNLTGYWSRRITLEHRLVYRFEDGVIHVVQCRYHY